MGTRWLLLFLAAVAPSLHAAAAPVDVAVALAPGHASRDGGVYAARVLVAGPPGEPFDLRAELGDGERQASRLWDGGAWLTSQRYAEAFGELDASGRLEGLVFLRVNPDSANYAAATAGPNGVFRFRVRPHPAGAASDWATHAVAWFGGPDTAAAIVGLATPGATVSAERDGLVALAVAEDNGIEDGGRGAGYFRLDVPPGPGYSVRAGGAVLAEDVTARAGASTWVGPEPQGARLLVTAFAFRAYDAARDDVVQVCSAGSAAAPLDGVTLRDGAGEVEFGGGLLGPGACLWLAADARAYERHVGAPADDSWDGDGALRERVALALGGDDVLALLRHGRVLDVVVWGRVTANEGWHGEPLGVSDAEGRLYRRTRSASGWLDSDTADDWWSPRAHRVGQSEFPLRTFRANATVFVAPDASFDVAARLVDTARETLVMGAYDLTSRPLVERVERAMDAGNVSRVRVLLEDSPAGESPESRDRTAALMARLGARGAEVRVTTGARYVFHHGKFIVADGQRALVGSENFNAHGYPPSRTYGNRGWGVVIESGPFARALLEAFEWDASSAASVPFAASPWARETRAPLFADASGPYRPRFAPLRVEANATLLLAPEHTVPPFAPLLDAVRGAEREVLAEMLTLAPAWPTDRGDLANPLLEAFVEAAQRGARVRVLLAGDFVRANDGTPDNLDAAGMLAGRARGLDLEVRLASPEELATVHNKGLVIDRRLVHVGSLNGNLASATRNREVGVLLESREAADYFAAAFEDDWGAWGVAPEALGAASRDPVPGPDAPSRPVLLGGATLFTVALVLVSMRRRRRRG